VERHLRNFPPLVFIKEVRDLKRIPDPRHQLEAYRQIAATLNFLRALLDGGYTSGTSIGCAASTFIGVLARR